MSGRVDSEASGVPAKSALRPPPYEDSPPLYDVSHNVDTEPLYREYLFVRLDVEFQIFGDSMSGGLEVPEGVLRRTHNDYVVVVSVVHEAAILRLAVERVKVEVSENRRHEISDRDTDGIRVTIDEDVEEIDKAFILDFPPDGLLQFLMVDRLVKLPHVDFVDVEGRGIGNGTDFSEHPPYRLLDAATGYPGERVVYETTEKSRSDCKPHSTLYDHVAPVGRVVDFAAFPGIRTDDMSVFVHTPRPGLEGEMKIEDIPAETALETPRFPTGFLSLLLELVMSGDECLHGNDFVEHVVYSFHAAYLCVIRELSVSAEADLLTLVGTLYSPCFR